MSLVADFIARPLPQNIDPETLAALEQMLQEIQTTLSAVRDRLDDHETRITALEP
jgi:hypothetical protein